MWSVRHFCHGFLAQKVADRVVGGKPQVLVDSAAADAAADAIASAIDNAIRAAETADVVLAGGLTPQACYLTLAEQDLEWDRVTFWLGDERCVPAGDPDANETMIRETLIGPLEAKGTPARLMSPDQTLDPAAMAYEYAEAIADHIGCGPGDPPAFDFVLLGLGEDAHTASLFPGSKLLSAEGPVVAVTDAPKPPPERITMTFPVFACAREVVVLAVGESKASAVAKACEAPSSEAPASLLHAGSTRLIVDAAAASELF